MHNLTDPQLAAIVKIGIANNWPASDVAMDAKKQQAAKDESTRAAGLLTLAQNLEKINKPSAALKSYRELLAKYPNSPEARTAKARISAISSGGMP
jgi:Tetratricopeptide repeat